MNGKVASGVEFVERFLDFELISLRPLENLLLQVSIEICPVFLADEMEDVLQSFGFDGKGFHSFLLEERTPLLGVLKTGINEAEVFHSWRIIIY